MRSAQITLSGFAPLPGAEARSYGIPQDDAARTGAGSPDVAQTNFTGAGANFSYSFAPYSASVLTLFSTATPPLVTMSSPTNGAVFGTPATLTLSADVVASGGFLTNVAFYSGATRLAQFTVAPYPLTLSNLALGQYSFTAIAADSNGLISTSAPVTISILIAVPASLIPTGAVWKYLDNGTDQGTAWRSNNFNDASWRSGPAQLGYGDGDEATVVSFGPNSNNKYITTYFRRSFFVPDAARIQNLTARLLRDDGAAIYLNGAEIWRSNLPATGAINYLTLAVTNVGGLDETTHFYTSPVSPSLLIEGTNLVAVEVHQSTNTSTDLSFDFALDGTAYLLTPPALGIDETATGVTLTAPAAAGFFRLLSATNLSPPITWTLATNTPSSSNGQWTVSLSVATNSPRFYRLRSE